jgi:hypothetical protein
MTPKTPFLYARYLLLALAGFALGCGGSDGPPPPKDPPSSTAMPGQPEPGGTQAPTGGNATAANPANAPRVTDFKLASNHVQPGTPVTAQATVADPDGDLIGAKIVLTLKTALGSQSQETPLEGPGLPTEMASSAKEALAGKAVPLVVMFEAFAMGAATIELKVVDAAGNSSNVETATLDVEAP